MPYVSSEASKKYHREYAKKWRSNPENRQKSAARRRELYAANPEAAREYTRRYRSSNPVIRKRLIEKASQWREENREKSRAWYRAHDGLPSPTRPQPDLCECCGRPPHAKGRSLCVDHCHETGEFRGWLCNGCNLAIGKLGDNEAGLLRALRYIRSRGAAE